MAEFNLIDDSWIPCIDSHGLSAEYGIRDTLLKAHALREICDESPLVTAALHRLLLAILYRACEGPSVMEEWRSLYERGHFAPGGGIDRYLTEWHGRFYLFDQEHPFMQVAGLDLNVDKGRGKARKDKSDGLMRLIREAPDKGGRILFDHRVGTERPEYEPRQISKMILSAQSYSGTGVASASKIGDTRIKPTNCQFAPCVEGFVLWLQGESLFQTLLLNLVPHPFIAADKPAWEDDSIVDTAIRSWKEPKTFEGPVQRFAPLSRFIRIIDLKSMFFTNGLKTKTDFGDPMKTYVQADEKSGYKAVKLRKDRAAWRDAHTLFSLGSTVRKPPAGLNHAAQLVRNGTIPKAAQPRANLVGLAMKQDKALLWRHERLPVPLGMLASDHLTERLEKRINEAESIGEQLSGGLFWNPSTRKTVRKEPVGRIQAIVDLVLSPLLELRSPGVLRTSDGRAPEAAHNKAALDLASSLDPRPAYWARLEKHFFTLLQNLPNDWDTAASDWKPDDQQEATRTWRKHVLSEAERALKESIRSLGTTARAIQSFARVRVGFNEYDLMSQSQKVAKARRESKGGKRK